MKRLSDVLELFVADQALLTCTFESSRRKKSVEQSGMSSVEPQKKRSRMGSSLEQLKNYTTVVSDTGDFEGELTFIYLNY